MFVTRDPPITNSFHATIQIARTENDMPEETTEQIEQLINDVYARFNARDIDGALAVMKTDVEWPNGMEGGYVYGHQAVRDYWTRQWTTIDPNVEPTAIDLAADGRVIVSVMQNIRDLEGNVLTDGLITHIYTIDKGLIERMEIVDL
jgi:ketosteroid isomerase-like protein